MAQSIWLNDKKMLAAIRKASDLLPQMETALATSARNAMNLAIATAPRDTGALVNSAFIEGIDTNDRSGAKNIRFGFRHPMAAFIEEGVRWGKSPAPPPKGHGHPAPRFLRRATQKHRKAFKAECIAIVNRWLAKNFKP